MSTTATPPAAPPVAPKPTTPDLIKAAFVDQMKSPAPAVLPPKPGETPPAKPAAVEPVKPPTPSLLPKKQAPVAKTEPAPAGDDPFEKFSLPDTAPEEQRSQFTELKRISRDQHKRIKEYETKLNAPAVPTAEVEKLRSEHKAALDRLAIVDLKAHPDFRRQFEEPKMKAVAEVAEVLGFNNKTTDIEGLLSKDRKTFNAAVADLTKDLNSMDATSVQTALRQAYQLSQDEKTHLSKAGELHQQMRQQEEARARQAFAEVSDNLGPVGEFLATLDTPDGATAEEKAEIESYNTAVTGLRSQVEKTAFGRQDEKGMAQLAWKGGILDLMLSHAFPRMDRMYQAAIAERNAFAEELAGVKAAKGVGTISGDPTKGGDGKKSTDQLVASAYGKSS